MMMMILQNQTNADNHHRPFSSSCESGAGGGGGVNGGDGDDGPTSMTMNISDISNVAAPPVTVAGGGRMAATAAAAAASTLGLFPFTSAQWKELETQAMIYKYLMASIPVPPELLFPISRYLSSDLDLSPASASNSTLAVVRGYLRYSNNKDPEPWRCKRTDGKKWRCAKDVAPDQKYCERHLHRGRPRSRKPVEQVHHHCDFTINNNSNNNNKGRFQSNVLPPNPLFCNARVTGNVGRNLGSSTAHPYIVNPFFLDRSDKKACEFDSLVSVSSYKEPRTMNWMMKGDAVPIASTSAPDQEWKQHLMQTKTGLTTNQNYYCNSNTSIFNQNYELEPLNLNSYANFVYSEGQSNWNPRCFIDAWSNTEMKDKNGSFSNNASVSSNGKLSLSSLNLSMGSNNTVKDEMGHLQMGLGLIESNNDYGGPLAEVLWPAVAGSASNLEFPMGRIGDSDSPQATTVSSPSGVLQKTLASLSDSSNCSSPTTLVVSRPEIAFQWLN